MCVCVCVYVCVCLCVCVYIYIYQRLVKESQVEPEVTTEVNQGPN